jgi:hypothetical protein
LRTKKRISKKDIAVIWNNGIVLRKKYVGKGLGTPVMYERVGRVLMEWPLAAAERDPRIRSLASTLLDFTKSHVVKIERGRRLSVPDGAGTMGMTWLELNALEKLGD